VVTADARRRVPRTDVILGDARLAEAVIRLGRSTVKEAVAAAQEQARQGVLDPSAVADAAVAGLPETATSLHEVINASGVVLHTNLGRAPLSDAALRAMEAAAGYVDVELDLATGRRAARGRGTLAALRAAVPSAEDALVVNNGAAAVLLATTALAAGREVVVSRGELVEIGDGFRLPDLIESTGARLHEVGTTNRVRLADYADAIGPATGCVMKVHPSNFRIQGFTAAVAIGELATLPVPVVADLGSGLLAPDSLLPEEPDVASALTAGADLVTASGDKLLGGPQAGLVFGRAELVERLRRHPLARAVRIDKLRLAALDATLRGPRVPVAIALHADAAELLARCERLADSIAADDVRVVEATGAVGGGGGPGWALPGWAVSLPEACAARLRAGRPAVVGRIERGRCLIDIRCVPPADDGRLAGAIRTALAAP
jgi:L-seryl-tRNA(Ser) seleniumtransferase